MKITAKQYAQTLYDLTDGKSETPPRVGEPLRVEAGEIEKAVADFARYIYRNRKLKLVDKIIGQFAKIYNKEKGIVEAEVVTREKMDEATERKVKDYIEKKYHAKEVVLNNIIDASIKGGVIIKVGDEVMDGSVVGRLSELKKTLVG